MTTVTDTTDTAVTTASLGRANDLLDEHEHTIKELTAYFSSEGHSQEHVTHLGLLGDCIGHIRQMLRLADELRSDDDLEGLLSTAVTFHQAEQLLASELATLTQLRAWQTAGEGRGR